MLVHASLHETGVGPSRQEPCAARSGTASIAPAFRRACRHLTGLKFLSSGAQRSRPTSGVTTTIAGSEATAGADALTATTARRASAPR